MKTLFSDPIDWATKAAGTRGRMYFMMFVHVVGWITLSAHNFSGNILWILFGVIFPCYYLYALHRVLLSRAG